MRHEAEFVTEAQLEEQLARNSIYPFMVDLGLVMILFGLFLIGRIVAVMGAVVLVTGLTGWIREARMEYNRLAD